MSLVSGEDILKFAVRIEENGLNFYRSFAHKLNSEKEKSIFSFLADEEEKHAALFKGMLDKIDSSKGRPNYPDEYAAYFQAYADNLIFDEDALKKEVSRIKDAAAAADFGIRRELDSILYYQEIKAFVPREEMDIVDDVIHEEREHFIKLTQFKKDLR